MSKAAELALAYDQMPPEDIRDHALAMATVIESQDEVIQSLLDRLVEYEGRVEISDKFRIDLHIAMRNIASLHAAGRKREAREYLQQAAATELVRDETPKIDRTQYRTAVEAWPHIFTPTPRKGSD